MYVRSGSPKSLSELDTAFGWIANSDEVDLKDVVQELQGLRVSTGVIASASALIEVRGSGGVSKAAALISTSDVIVGALVTTGGGASGTTGFSLRNDVRIAATPGYISISGTVTGGQTVLLFWMDKTGYSAY